jgi:hypothetical protein
MKRRSEAPQHAVTDDATSSTRPTVPVRGVRDADPLVERAAHADRVARTYAATRTHGGLAKVEAPPPQPAPRFPAKRPAFHYELWNIGPGQFGKYVERHLRAAEVPAQTAKACGEAGEAVARWAITGEGGVDLVEMVSLTNDVAQLLAGKSADAIAPYTLDGVVLRAAVARARLRRDEPLTAVDLWALSTAVPSDKSGLSQLEREGEGSIPAAVARAWLRRWGIES